MSHVAAALAASSLLHRPWFHHRRTLPYQGFMTPLGPWYVLCHLISHCLTDLPLLANARVPHPAVSVTAPSLLPTAPATPPLALCTLPPHSRILLFRIEAQIVDNPSLVSTSTSPPI